MKLRVCANVYSVKLVKDLRMDGAKADGGWDWRGHVFWIDADLPPSRRLQVLLHEFRHAWQFELGRPADDEADAQQAANFAIDAMRQIERQGGEMALMRMTLDGVVDQTADVNMPYEPRAASCPACGGLLNMPVRMATPAFEARFNRLLARRAADCEFCGHEVSWLEAVTGAGVPTGQVIGEPTVTRCASVS